ncbi:MAG: flippase activity-associated protein Agl23 [Puniceicoccaceae bacterium]
MHQRFLIAFAWIVLALMAVFIRFNNLPERPVHADEATGARILAQRLEEGSYSFDPTHFHGPLLTAAATPVARLRDESSWKELSEATIRIVPALAGSLLVLTPLLLLRWIGHTGALAGALLLATSPLLAYYSRMFIHEMLLALAVLLAMAAFFHHVKQPGRLSAFIAGLAMGLMWTAKETLVITLLAWGVALVPAAMAYWGPLWITRLRERVPSLGWLLIGVILTSLLFYTDFFRNPAGALHSIETFLVYETVAGHEKPFSYYAHLLLWPKFHAGVLWWEGVIGVMALAAVFLHGKKQASPERRSFVIFLGISTAAHFIIYSLISYKTPWLMVVPWAHACLLAGCLMLDLSLIRKPIRYAGIGGMALVAALQLHQTLQANGRFAQDSRNPYAYVPTTRDAVRLGKWLVDLDARIQPQSVEPIAVIGNGYWPLPWYLREFSSIGYWPQAGEFLKDQPLAIVLPGHFEVVEDLLHATHTALPRGLRQDTPIMVHIRNDLWETWMEAPEE